MPTYEFRCPSGHDFEKFFRKISAAHNEMPCPECGQVSGRRLSAGAGLVFKGSGFYLTDYGRAGSKNGAEQSGAPETAKESKSDAKTPDAAGGGTAAAGGKDKPATSKSEAGKGAKDSKST
jgi:putative FmdB family regulatory protein